MPFETLIRLCNLCVLSTNATESFAQPMYALSVLFPKVFVLVAEALSFPFIYIFKLSDPFPFLTNAI